MIQIKSTLLLLISVICTNSFSAETGPKTLVKVTVDNKKECVEYVNYKGEMYCTTQSTTQTKDKSLDINQYEKQNIKFDHRLWIAVFEKADPMMSSVEYIVQGDDINHWHELITSQFSDKIPKEITVQQFAELAMNNMKKAGFNPLVTVHESSPEQLVFEFRILEPKSQEQDELQIIKKINNNFYILHYVIKKADMGSDNRTLWLNNLKKSTIK